MGLPRDKSNDEVKRDWGVTPGANTEPVVICLGAIVDQVSVIKAHVEEASKHAAENGQGVSMFKGKSQSSLDELKQSLEGMEAGAEDLYSLLSGQVDNGDKPSQQ